MIAGSAVGSDSSLLGSGLTGTSNGRFDIITGSGDAFFDNFGASNAANGSLLFDPNNGFAVLLSGIFDAQSLRTPNFELGSLIDVGARQVFQSSITTRITTVFNSAGQETESDLDTGVSESLFVLTSIFLLSGNELLLPPHMNPNLPQRPDDAGVENPDPDNEEHMAIEEEWQVFYVEDLAEFLVAENYVRSSEEGEVVPEDQALFEQYLQALIALYENVRAQERAVLAAELGELELEDDLGGDLIEDDSDQFEDDDLDLDDLDLDDDELDIDIDLDDEAAGGSLGDDTSAAASVRAPIALAGVGHTGQGWLDGGLGVDGSWWKRLGSAWSGLVN